MEFSTEDLKVIKYALIDAMTKAEEKGEETAQIEEALGKAVYMLIDRGSC